MLPLLLTLLSFASLSTLDSVLGTVVERAFSGAAPAGPNAAALQRAVQRVVVNTLLDRAGDKEAIAAVREGVELQLTKLDARLVGAGGGRRPTRRCGDSAPPHRGILRGGRRPGKAVAVQGASAAVAVIGLGTRSWQA